LSAEPIKHWSALLPLVLSVAALALVLGHVASGGVREADEGTAAHLWQLFMALQLPLIGLFAFIWLPRSARPALAVLALLMAVVLANFAVLRFYEL
jgi:hypothetical protein